MTDIDPLFASYKLNATGLAKSKALSLAFTNLLRELETIGCTDGRNGAIVKTNLEQAKMHATKAVATNPINQEPE